MGGVRLYLCIAKRNRSVEFGNGEGADACECRHEGGANEPYGEHNLFMFNI